MRYQVLLEQEVTQMAHREFEADSEEEAKKKMLAYYTRGGELTWEITDVEDPEVKRVKISST